MQNDLKRCPFCIDGGKPYVHAIGNNHSRKIGDGAEVGCKKCHFKKIVGVIRQSVEWAVNEATKEWNTRHEAAKASERPVMVVSQTCTFDNLKPGQVMKVDQMETKDQPDNLRFELPWEAVNGIKRIERSIPDQPVGLSIDSRNDRICRYERILNAFVSAQGYCNIRGAAEKIVEIDERSGVMSREEFGEKMANLMLNTMPKPGERERYETTAETLKRYVDCAYQVYSEAPKQETPHPAGRCTCPCHTDDSCYCEECCDGGPTMKQESAQPVESLDYRKMYEELLIEYHRAVCAPKRESVDDNLRLLNEETIEHFLTCHPKYLHNPLTGNERGLIRDIVRVICPMTRLKPRGIFNEIEDNARRGSLQEGECE